MEKRIKLDIESIGSWEDVDSALGVLRLTDARLETLTAEADVEIQRAQEAKRRRTRLLVERRERVAALVQAFVDAHRDGIGVRRTLKLTHGEVGFRWGKPKVEIQDEEQAKRLLRLRGHEDCIVTQESIDKEALRRLPDSELSLCGVAVVQAESFVLKLAKEPVVPYPQVEEPAEAPGDEHAG